MIINHSYNPSPQWAWKFKELLHEELKKLPDEFTLAFSAGIDSSMILYSLMEIGKPPKQLLTFQIEDWETDDLIYAKKISQELGIPLTISKIPIPTYDELSRLIVDIKSIVDNSGKITIQCCHGFHYMLQDMETDNLVLGMYEDIIYETNAKMHIKFQQIQKGLYPKEKFDEEYKEWKTACYNDKMITGSTHNHFFINKFIEHHGINTYYPLKSSLIHELFQEVDYPTTHLVPYKGGFKIKKKWFVTDLLWKEQFNKFGNGGNNSNMHAKKKGKDLNQLHCDLLGCNAKEIKGKYNKMVYVRNNWFN